MLKKAFLALFIYTLASSAQAQAPTSEEVKQALYDRYAISQSAGQLRNALQTEVAVGGCVPQGNQYQCQIDNKALGTSIPMIFDYDQSAKKWKYVREIRN